MTLHFTASEQAEFETEQNRVHFGSNLGFLNAHNGLRRGSLHLVLGTTGGGKSTLVRTILRDLIFRPEKEFHVALWLSEEEVQDYRAQVAYGMPSHDRLLNTSAFSELCAENVSELRFFEWLEFNKPDVLIFDNITTSKFYNDRQVSEQGKFANKLKQATKRLNMATIVIAHTDAKATDSMGRLITINDIRGSKTISNLAEFAYILQRFELEKNFFPTIRTVKHRSQELIHNLYMLIYDNRLRSFSGDKAIEFKQFKEVFNARNKLDK